MSVDGWNTLLVLGGIRSGKSEFAESLVSGATSVRYLATSAPVSLSDSPDDPEWESRIAAHRDRRPETWETDEVGADPGLLVATLLEAKPDETLLVDDLGGWVGVLLDPAHQPADDVKTIEELAAAVRGCAARLILVSPEVGLTLVPTTPLGRAFTDALGTVNQAVAAATDAVVLVVAGQPTWLKGLASSPVAAAVAPTLPSESVLPDVPAPVALPEVITPVAAPVLAPTASSASSASSAGDALRGPTHALPIVKTGLVIQPNMELPLPDDETGPAAIDRLATLDLGGTGLGELAGVVRFAAATQATDTPRPWQSVRVLLVQGDHAGGASAGVPAGEPNRRAAQARLGIGALAQLAASAGATLQVVDAPAAAPIEDGPALTLDEVDDALRLGWRLAEDAVDNGADLLVIAAAGAGSPAAAAAVLAATAGAEPAAVLPPVRTPDGGFDDNAWMERCAAIRDAMQRVRKGGREAKDILAQVGGGDVAVATGILLGATARRTPVLLDGPVGVAAALVSRDLAGQARHWCLLPDHNGDPAVKLAADVLGLTPVLNMRLDLGEGTAALAALPLLRSAITLAGSLPPRSVPAAEDADSGSDLGSGGEAVGGVGAGAAGLPTGADGVSGPGGNGAGAAATTEYVVGSVTDPADESVADLGSGTTTDSAAFSATSPAAGTVVDSTGSASDDEASKIVTAASGTTASADRTPDFTSSSSAVDDATNVITGPSSAAGDATNVITGPSSPAGDVTAVISGGTDDATTVISKDAGTAGDTTAVIPRAGGSVAAEVDATPAEAASSTNGVGSGTSAAGSADDDPERTTVISTPAVPADDSPTTAFRVPPKDDPDATTVIATGTPATFAQPAADDDESANSWIPGFGNPRRSDDPGTPATR